MDEKTQFCFCLFFFLKRNGSNILSVHKRSACVHFNLYISSSVSKTKNRVKDKAFTKKHTCILIVWWCEPMVTSGFNFTFYAHNILMIICHIFFLHLSKHWIKNMKFISFYCSFGEIIYISTQSRPQCRC